MHELHHTKLKSLFDFSVKLVVLLPLQSPNRHQHLTYYMCSMQSRVECMIANHYAYLTTDSRVSVLSFLRLSYKYCRMEAAKRCTLVIGCEDDPLLTACSIRHKLYRVSA